MQQARTGQQQVGCAGSAACLHTSQKCSSDPAPVPHANPVCPQEIDEQWGLYDGYSPHLARVLRFRRAYGRHMPLMKVSPPGLDFSNLKASAAGWGCLSACVCALRVGRGVWETMLQELTHGILVLRLELKSGRGGGGVRR